MLIRFEANKLGALHQKIDIFAFLRNTRKVALNVCCKNWNAHIGESFGHDLQRYGFAGAGGASY